MRLNFEALDHEIWKCKRAFDKYPDYIYLGHNQMTEFKQNCNYSCVDIQVASYNGIKIIEVCEHNHMSIGWGIS